GKLSAFDFDLRVRDRHVAAGVLDQKVLDRYLAELPDVEALSEPLPFEQPALGGRDQGQP
ncbi:MAG TPA: hypothetical protein VHB21_16835, partial [Minicystis sp.]|nr:hypothetical protein [Minicystis sp.]